MGADCLVLFLRPSEVIYFMPPPLLYMINFYLLAILLCFFVFFQGGCSDAQNVGVSMGYCLLLSWDTKKQHYVFSLLH